LAAGGIRRVFFEVFDVNGETITLAVLSLRKNRELSNLRRHELLLHPLTLSSAGFLALHVFWQRVVLHRWRVLPSMQRTSNLHSSHPAAFRNPAPALPCCPDSSAARCCAGMAGAGEGARGSREHSGQQQPSDRGPEQRRWLVVGPWGAACGLWCRRWDRREGLQPLYCAALTCLMGKWRKHIGESRLRIPWISVPGQNFHKALRTRPF